MIKFNFLRLALCGALLEWAATLSTFPVGTQVVPFQQNLSISTLIEDQLLGTAVLGSPVIGGVLLLPPCFLLTLCSQLSPEERAGMRQTVNDKLRQYFSTADLLLTIAEAIVIEEVPVTVTNVEMASSTSSTAVTALATKL